MTTSKPRGHANTTQLNATERAILAIREYHRMTPSYADASVRRNWPTLIKAIARQIRAATDKAQDRRVRRGTVRT